MLTSRHRWLGATPLLLAVTLGALTTNVVAVPIVQISESLGVQVSTGALVLTVATLGLATLMPLAGWVGERFGDYRVLRICLTSFLLAVVGAALAPTFELLLLCRLWQGLSLAVVPVAVMRMLPQLFGEAGRGKALGLWAAANALGQALAPPIGGVVSDLWGWRAIFWGVVPVALVTLALMRFAPRSKGIPSRFDVYGALTLSLGVGSLLLSLVFQTGIPGSGVIATIVCVAVTVASLTLFAFRINLVTYPFVPPSLFRSARFLWSSATGFVQMFCLAILITAMPVYLLADKTFSLSGAGLLMLTVSGAMACLGPMAGNLAVKLGSRKVLRGGLVLLALALLGLTVAVICEVRSMYVLAPVLFAAGAGIASLQSPSAVGAAEAIQRQATSSGASLGLFNTVRFSGAAAGAAMVSILIGNGSGTGSLLVLAAVVSFIALGTTYLREQDSA